MTTRRALQREPAFEVKRAWHEGELRQVVIVACAKCHKVEEMTWATAPMPGYINKKMTSLGWVFDPFKKSGCICPACNPRSKVEIAVPAHTETSSAALMTTRHGRALTPPSQRSPEELAEQFYQHLDGETDMRRTYPPQVATTKRTPPTPPVEFEPVAEQPMLPRALTSDERLRVRNLLDNHFDDAAGYYIGGYSDQRIGTELNVPWAAVAQIREAAYGPLKEDERLTKLRADFAALKADLNKFDAAARVEINRLNTAAKTEIDKLNNAMRSLGTRLTEIETKLKEMQHD
jgi:hypothetical protein